MTAWFTPTHAACTAHTLPHVSPASAPFRCEAHDIIKEVFSVRVGSMCVEVCVFVSAWVWRMKAKASESWARAACVCPARGSGPGLCRLPRWGSAGAEWEGGVGGKNGPGALSQSCRWAPRQETAKGRGTLRRSAPCQRLKKISSEVRAQQDTHWCVCLHSVCVLLTNCVNLS